MAILLLGVLLAACGSPSGLSPAAHRQLDGQVLGWGPYLYKLTTTVVPSTELGKKLGSAVYHGRVAAGFTIYQIKVHGRVLRDALAFSFAGDGPAFKAVRVRGPTSP